MNVFAYTLCAKPEEKVTGSAHVQLEQILCLCGPEWFMNAKFCKFLGRGHLGNSPLGGNHTVGVLFVWESSSQGEAGNLVLLMEQANGRRQGKCSPALSGSRKVRNQHLHVV